MAIRTIIDMFKAGVRRLCPVIPDVVVHKRKVDDFNLLAAA
jgi:hypothetical protein